MGKNKDRKTEFDKLAEDVAGIHSKRMNAILLTMGDEDFSVNYFKLLEYAKPKLQRQDVNLGVDINSITIKRVDIPLEDLDNEE